MDISAFLVGVYCMVDDNMPVYRLRKRGLQPQLSNCEVINIPQRVKQVE